MIPYSTQVKIKPIYDNNPLLIKERVTNKGQVIEIGENVSIDIIEGDTVVFNLDSNTLYEGHFFIDQEYIEAVL